MRHKRTKSERVKHAREGRRTRKRPGTRRGKREKRQQAREGEGGKEAKGDVVVVSRGGDGYGGRLGDDRDGYGCGYGDTDGLQTDSLSGSHGRAPSLRPVSPPHSYSLLRLISLGLPLVTFHVLLLRPFFKVFLASYQMLELKIEKSPTEAHRQ